MPGLAEVSEHLSLEIIEVFQPTLDCLEDQLIVDAPVLVDEEVAEPLHAPKGVRHRRREGAVTRELDKQIVLFAGKAEAQARDEQGADIDAVSTQT